MNIPKRNGHYEFKAGPNTIVIDITTVSERMSKLDKIQTGDRSRIGGYRYVPNYEVKVLDSNGNIIDSFPSYYSTDENKYIEYVSSFIGNGASMNPNKLLSELAIKFQKETGLYVKENKFSGVVRNNLKLTFYVDDWNSVKGGRYDPSEISSYFEKLGVVCKIAEKKKNVRSSECWVVSVYLPLDFNLNESRNMKKQVIRLTESDLHKIIKESVRKVLKETDCASVMQTGCGNAPKGTNPEAGQYPVPFGPDEETSDRTPGKVAVGGRAKWNVNNGNVQRRSIYNPKSGKK